MTNVFKLTSELSSVLSILDPLKGHDVKRWESAKRTVKDTYLHHGLAAATDHAELIVEALEDLQLLRKVAQRV